MSGKDRDKKYQPLWLAVYFYQLPLDRLEKNNKDAALAIVEKQRIMFANEAAIAQGIVPDMRIASAFALNPDIIIVEREEHKEQQTLDALTQWCYQFSPTVSAYKYYTVLIEIGGSLRLFHGMTRLLQAINEGLTQQGFCHVNGLAHTQEAAWLLSQYRAANPQQPLSIAPLSEFNAPDAAHWRAMLKLLPLHFLYVDEKQHKQLFSVGLRTLGDVFALPGDELGKRFGKPFLQLLNGIQGDIHLPLQHFLPDLVFDRCWDFNSSVTQISEIEKVAEALVAQLYGFIRTHHVATQTLMWTFYYFKIPADKIIVSVSPGNNNRDSFLQLTLLKFNSYTLKAPVESLRLHCDKLSVAESDTDQLFPELSLPSQQLQDYRHLLDKLLNRLGDTSLMALSLGDEHLPEYQQNRAFINGMNIDRLSAQAALQAPRHLSMKESHIKESHIKESPAKKSTTKKLTTEESSGKESSSKKSPQKPHSQKPRPQKLHSQKLHPQKLQQQGKQQGKENSNEYLPLWLAQTPVPISPPMMSTLSKAEMQSINATAQSPLRIVYGPTRIDSHWWHQRQLRDYFIARHKNGSYCWVFQNSKNKQWFMQGFFG